MTGVRRRMAALAAAAVIGLISPAASADPWKDESGFGRGRGGECRGRGRDCDDHDRADYGDRDYRRGGHDYDHDRRGGDDHRRDYDYRRGDYDDRRDRRDVVADARAACRRIARGRDWRDVDTDVRREGDDRVVITVQGERRGGDRERRCVYSIRRDDARFEDQRW